MATPPSRGSLTREALVERAGDLFRARGFRATSIGDVVEHTGVPKGSLYHHFPSKDQLGYAVLDRWRDEFQTRFIAPLLAAEGPAPLERVTRFLGQFVEAQRAGTCRGGCPFGRSRPRWPTSTRGSGRGSRRPSRASPVRSRRSCDAPRPRHARGDADVTALATFLSRRSRRRPAREGVPLDGRPRQRGERGARAPRAVPGLAVRRPAPRLTTRAVAAPGGAGAGGRKRGKGRPRGSVSGPVARLLPRSAAALVLAGLALVPAGCGPDAPRPAPPPAPRAVRYAADGRPTLPDVVASRRLDVLWVCLDTVRADAFAPWARGEVAMPATSAWLERHAVAFTQASSPAPWTGPAVASLLTGLLPSAHGARELSEGMSLVPAVTTAAEILGAQGWFTVAYTGGGWVAAANGMLQGFREPLTPFSFAGEAENVLKVFEGSRAYRPRFLFFHTYEAHDPYLAPPARLHAPPTPPPTVDLAAIDREAAADGGRSLVRRFLLDAGSREAVFGTAFGGARKAAVTRWLERGFRTDPEAPALAADARPRTSRACAASTPALAGWLTASTTSGSSTTPCSSSRPPRRGLRRARHDAPRSAPLRQLIHVPLCPAPGFTPAASPPPSLLDVLPTTLEPGPPPVAARTARRSSAARRCAGRPSRRGPARAPRRAATTTPNSSPCATRRTSGSAPPTSARARPSRRPTTSSPTPARRAPSRPGRVSRRRSRRSCARTAARADGRPPAGRRASRRRSGSRDREARWPAGLASPRPRPRPPDRRAQQGRTGPHRAVRGRTGPHGADCERGADSFRNRCAAVPQSP
jgi:AcrR family transcriptional regulator